MIFTFLTLFCPIILLSSVIIISKLISYDNDKEKYKKILKSIVTIFILFMSFIIFIQNTLFRQTSFEFDNIDTNSRYILSAIAFNIFLISLLSIKINNPNSYLMVILFYIKLAIFFILNFIAINLYDLSFSKILYICIYIITISFLIYNSYKYYISIFESEQKNKKKKLKKKVTKN